MKGRAVCPDIYVQPQPVLRQRGIAFQHDLIAAFRGGDADAVHRIMVEHMTHGEQQMLALEAELEHRFID